MNGIYFSRLARAASVFVCLAYAPVTTANRLPVSALGAFSHVLFHGKGAAEWDIANADATGLAQLRWGVASGKSNYQRNYYTFAGIGSHAGNPPFVASAGQPFSLGSFVYYNAPTQKDKIYGMDFTLQLNIAAQDQSPLRLPMLIDSTRDKGKSGYATINLAHSAAMTQPWLFTTGDQQYSFQLLGFSNNGGLTFGTSLASRESGQSSAQLYGRYTPVAAVPLPAAGWLFLTGIGGLFACVRRRRTAA